MAEGAGPQSLALGGAAAAALERCLAAGGVALVPTDTVYGLVCDVGDAEAIRRIYELKLRPAPRPSAVMFFSLQAALAELAELDETLRGALLALLPGPVTVLLPGRWERFRNACDPAGAVSHASPSGPGSTTQAAGGGGAYQPVAEGAVPEPGAFGRGALLGLRVPALPGAAQTLARIRRPMLQTSANPSGGRDARSLGEVAGSIRAGVALEIDGGRLSGRASTVLDLSEFAATGRWRIRRAGPIGEAELAERLQAPPPGAC